MVGRTLKIGIVGATGVVGREMLSILDERKFPVGELVPFASSRSAGKEVHFQGRKIPCRTLSTEGLKDLDLVFLDASDAVSEQWVPQAAGLGAWVVDNSATYRMDPQVPLIVPEVNASRLFEGVEASKKSSDFRARVIAGPNCSVAPLVVVLKPLLDRWGIERVVLSTYQSTSGGGVAAMEDHREQTQAFLNGKPVVTKHFPHPIAFNCIPQVGGFQDDNYTSEEHKTIREARKILGLPDLRITSTCIRVPAFICHAESVNIELKNPFEIEEIKQVLQSAEGVELMDDPEQKAYPMTINTMGRDPVTVGRIRKDESLKWGLNLWLCSDNLRKGAALNGVQIGEKLIQANAFG